MSKIHNFDKFSAKQITSSMRKPYSRKIPVTKKTKNYHVNKTCIICGTRQSNPAEHLKGFHKIIDKKERDEVLKKISLNLNVIHQSQHRTSTMGNNFIHEQKHC